MLALFRRKPAERPGFVLYGHAVAAARVPRWYAELGVPDTLDGRFDMIGVFAFLLIDRTRTDPDPHGTVLAQAVFDAMFADMDQNLRQMGVGDLSVGKRVKVMWEAFHGRATAYQAALDDDTPGALEAALARNVWRSAEPVPAAAELARVVTRVREALAHVPLAALAQGSVPFDLGGIAGPAEAPAA